jgi:hypothetical protein
MRKTIVEKQIQMERLKLEIKLYRIINPQIFFLNEWAKLERRNQESVSRMTRKLSGLSVRLPLVQGAKVLYWLYMLIYIYIYIYIYIHFHVSALIFSVFENYCFLIGPEKVHPTQSIK